MNEELVPWVSEEDVLIKMVPRSMVHDKANLLLHREVMQLLFSDATHTHFLMQKRSDNKVQYPGLWTLSSTSHVNSDDISGDDPEGYFTSGRREAPEEIGVDAVNQKLVAKKIIRTEVNHAMAGVIVGEYVGWPRADKTEVSEVRLFDEKSIAEIRNQLTPNALICLILLGILQNEEITL